MPVPEATQQVDRGGMLDRWTRRPLVSPDPGLLELVAQLHGALIIKEHSVPVAASLCLGKGKALLHMQWLRLGLGSASSKRGQFRGGDAERSHSRDGRPALCICAKQCCAPRACSRAMPWLRWSGRSKG